MSPSKDADRASIYAGLAELICVKGCMPWPASLDFLHGLETQ
ncbi:hypothetical protein OHA77_20030 [Streptosporangium sp. NBC_01639]|nr:hypothetical protein OHA77_20030 [Streptosporangium sp. NBC_01639]